MTPPSGARRCSPRFLPALAAALVTIALSLTAVPASADPATKTQKAPRHHKSHRHVPTAATPTARHHHHRAANADLDLKSNSFLVVDRDTGEVVAEKNPDVSAPIASITKLMTALVVLDARLPLTEVLQVSADDVDTERHTYSRLAVGTRLTREDLLLLALMASENRAAMALSRNYPGGRSAFITQMNAKAHALGMSSTRFADPAGLSNGSMSTARDLQRLLVAADAEPLIRLDSTTTDADFRIRGRPTTFVNTNRLVRGGDWDIAVQKTGFTNEAGRCLVMQANVASRRLSMVFLDSVGIMTRFADAMRVRRRLEIEARSGQQQARPTPVAVMRAAAS